MASCSPAADESGNPLSFPQVEIHFGVSPSYAVSFRSGAFPGDMTRIRSISVVNPPHVHMQGIEHSTCTWGGCPPHNTSFCFHVIYQRTDICAAWTGRPICIYRASPLRSQLRMPHRIIRIVWTFRNVDLQHVYTYNCSCVHSQ